jgi:hypothetical protein
MITKIIYSGERNRNREKRESLSLGYIISAVFILVFSQITVFAGGAVVKIKNGPSYISFQKPENGFTVSSAGKTVPLLISSSDYPGVLRAVNDLKSDLQAVTNSEVKIYADKTEGDDEVIIIGTLGKNPLIDKLAKEQKIIADSIKGKWDAFIIQSVENPVDGIKRALVIAGGSKRGTIYGVYDFSERIGVSPWYWWADVPVKKHADIFALSGSFYSGEPAVKYRGIFLNDEMPALGGWAYEKFGGFNHKYYEKVFELILRLKGNYLWPAMWNNNFGDDDSLNPKLADEYGIVMGTSHHEPMMRSWKEWPKYGKGEWNYQINDTVLRNFWENGIKRMNGYESLVTLGMRGNGDEEMSENANISLLEKIIADQRNILGRITKLKLTEIPQVWALYKEVQDYYDKGMQAPDDVTLLLCDDNWGNLRRLPQPGIKPRAGGYGIYYHFDYVGGPRNYKWLNTVQIERVWEQMHIAYEYGVNKIWIVNVGDLKPLEFPISFFLDYAWNPDEWPLENLPEYYSQWAEKQFGALYARDIADILAKYTKFNARKKPEMLSPDTYSLTNYREAETVVNDFRNLLTKAKSIYDSLPGQYKDSYFQLVLHPVLACSTVNELYYYAAKNNLYAMQGRNACESMADSVRRLFIKDSLITLEYNKKLSGGKWNHFMDQTHIGYTYWQQPDFNAMPALKEIQLPEKWEMGIAPEGDTLWFPKDSLKLSLPEIDSFNKQIFSIDIFNRGKLSFDYRAISGKDWLKIDKSSGRVEREERIFLRVDWKNAPKGKYIIPVTIQANGESEAVVCVPVNNIAEPLQKGFRGFVESDGYVSIEACNYTKTVGLAPVEWEVIPNLGRAASAVSMYPANSPAAVPGGNSPHIEYDVYLFGKGEVNVKTYLSPTLKFNNKDLHYAVSFDDGKPVIVNMTPNPNPPDLNRDGLWNKWVSDNINIQSTKLSIKNSGYHTLKFWMVDPGVVLQKIVIDLGGVKPSYLGPPESFNTIEK